MYEFLKTPKGGSLLDSQIILFPNGVNEILLESTLNSVLEEIDCLENTQILLYFCTLKNQNLSLKNQQNNVEVIQLGSEQIRKDVILYYEDFAKKLGVKFSVVYESDANFVSEDELGWKKVG